MENTPVEPAEEPSLEQGTPSDLPSPEQTWNAAYRGGPCRERGGGLPAPG